MGLNNSRNGLFIPPNGTHLFPGGSLYSPNAAHKAYFASWALAKLPGGDSVGAEKGSIDNLQLQSIFQIVSLGRSETPPVPMLWQTEKTPLACSGRVK